MSEIVLQTHDLKKYFAAKGRQETLKAVDGVSLQVRRGEIFGFLGPNGAGKTTTIGMILGLRHPTEGSVTILGEPVTPANNRPLRNVGALVGASPALLPYLSARQNLELAARLDGGNACKRIDATLERVGLKDAAQRKAGNFSTGMKQRLGLGMALLHRPELLILDEPTNGMDPAGMREVRDLLRSLALQGATVFLSSHLLHEVEQVCDRVAVLNKGRLVAQGSVSELLGKEKRVRVRVPSPGEAATLLLTVPGVSNVRPNGAYVEVSGVTGETVVAALTSNGIIPSEVINGQSDLESLFLSLTKER
ncbi:MAG: ABC transporter ATP-binding protein [Chloroflexota bacterium]